MHDPIMHDPGRGLFLVLEGIEGAGKSTQIRALARWMDELGVEHEVTREPGGTEVGELIRELVLHRPELDVPPESELFLILAARAAFVRDVVRPALGRGRGILSDRFDLSTLAYQGFGRRLDVREIRRMNDVATGGLRPDLYLLLDLPVEAGLRRQKRQGKEGDRIESAGAGFLDRVRDGYLEMAREDPRVVRIGAEAPSEAVQERIRDVLLERFPETFTDE